MKFSLAFLQANIAMFKSICLSDNLDYIAFYQVGELYAIADNWEEVHKSTFIIEC